MKPSLPFVLAIFFVLLLQALLGNSAALFSTQTDEMENFGFEEDDILYTPEQEAFIRGERKASPFLSSRWPEVDGFPEIPFAFKDNLVDQTRIKKAIGDWEKHTCLKFKEVTPDYTGNHIYFQRHSSICSSSLGMINEGGQPIKIPDWCELKDNKLIHEIGHAIGLYHEQMRSDRDRYVHINPQNINENNIFNFDKANDNNYSVPYDYGSVMHYSFMAFSKNDKTTMVPINPLYQSILSWKYGLSHMDKLVVNRMYSCIEKNLDKCSISSDPCQNNGYTGKDCQCVCPYGTSGSNCETWTASHNDEHLSPYSEKITIEGTIKSPLYPDPTPEKSMYTKWIVAPECKQIKLTFKDITDSERLEIRTKDMFDGNWYWGSQLKGGAIFTSDGNEMIVFSMMNSGVDKWSANVSFEHNPKCIDSYSTDINDILIQY